MSHNSATPWKLKGAHVLIVDDVQPTLTSLTRLLESQGCAVVGVGTVASALAEIERASAPFDAAVVDYYLVDERGLEVVRALREGPMPCSALLITAERSSMPLRNSIAAGADDVLLKPFEPEDFLGAVQRTVEQTMRWRKSLGFAHDAPTASNTSALSVASSWPMPASKSAPLDLEACVERLAKDGRLSAREREVLEGVLKGQRNIDIAQVMGVKERTVKYHVGNILRKLKVRSRKQLSAMVFDLS